MLTKFGAEIYSYGCQESKMCSQKWKMLAIENVVVTVDADKKLELRYTVMDTKNVRWLETVLELLTEFRSSSSSELKKF